MEIASRTNKVLTTTESTPVKNSIFITEFLPDGSVHLNANTLLAMNACFKYIYQTYVWYLKYTNGNGIEFNNCLVYACWSDYNEFSSSYPHTRKQKNRSQLIEVRLFVSLVITLTSFMWKNNFECKPSIIVIIHMLMIFLISSDIEYGRCAYLLPYSSSILLYPKNDSKCSYYQVSM